ncbi:MAG: oxidoreductase [Luminiphilus sp.]|jgi:NAD(P)-dependent dehydrogenase (short-subunit alcohol dehydrogenase family)|nr:oxidoreductase [Luminiphilus sp.]
MDTNKKVALITGASSGIGADIAMRMASAGYAVYAGARRVDRMRELEAAGINISELDVTSAASIASFVQGVLEQEKKIDILINNAGYGSYGAVEDVDIEEARRQFEVNLFGLAAMTNAVLPSMRSNRSGTIIHMGSVGGKLWSVLGGWYQASKYALEGLADCTRNELRPFGIHVVLLEPGGIKSEWRENVMSSIQKTSGNGPYSAIATAANSFFEGAASLEAQPKVVSDLILKVCSSDNPKPRYVVPTNAKIMLVLKALLTDRFFDKIWSRFMKIPKSM